MSLGLKMAGRIRKASGFAGNKITNMLCSTKNMREKTSLENVNEITGLDDDDSTSCQEMMKQLIDKIDHLSRTVKKLNEDSISTKEVLSTVRFRAMPWESDISRSLQRIFYLEWKLEALERGLKRNNIIISGLDANVSNPVETVRQFLNCTFDRSVGVEKAMVFLRTNKPSLITVTLTSNEDKKRIMAAREILKGTNIYINNEETSYEKNVRLHLRQIAEDEAQKGNTVATGYKFLIVNGEKFVWKHGLGLEKVPDKD